MIRSTPFPRIPLLSPPSTRHAPFSTTSAQRARVHDHSDHYQILGVPHGSTKQVIKDKFYELSRIYHPDAPSTSAAGSLESRTARFQTLSQSYSILSDDTLRRQYDSTLSHGGSYRSNRRPTYTSAGAGHESGSGFGGFRSSSAADNAQRRERANYAWGHPTRKAPTAEEIRSASERRENNYKRGQGMGTSANIQDHFNNFAKREAKTRLRASASIHMRTGTAMGGMGAQPKAFANGTSDFGDTAEEEDRLINDSGLKRSAQVFLVFAGAFAVSGLLGGDRRREHETTRRRN